MSVVRLSRVFPCFLVQGFDHGHHRMHSHLEVMYKKISNNFMTDRLMRRDKKNPKKEGEIIIISKT